MWNPNNPMCYSEEERVVSVIEEIFDSKVSSMVCGGVVVLTVRRVSCDVLMCFSACIDGVREMMNLLQ